MIPEIEDMICELNSLLGAKEEKYLLAEYCPERIKNSIFNFRRDILTFNTKAEGVITDMAVRNLILAEYSAEFNRIKEKIGWVRIK